MDVMAQQMPVKQDIELVKMPQLREVRFGLKYTGLWEILLIWFIRHLTRKMIGLVSQMLRREEGGRID